MFPFPCGSSPALSCLAQSRCEPPRSRLPGPRLPLPRPLAVRRQLGPGGVCLSLPSPSLSLVYSLGFFSLTSIAYRRVIRVYQYEVGDDLSGRFFSSYFSSLTVVFPMHSDFPGGSAF